MVHNIILKIFIVYTNTGGTDNAGQGKTKKNI